MMAIVAIATLIALLGGVVGSCVTVFLVPWGLIFRLSAEKPTKETHD